MSLIEVHCHGSIMKTIQEEMCAADLIAPCRVRGVRTGPGNFSMITASDAERDPGG